MTCTTCLTNCDPLVTDKCTKYTGPDREALGICKGMSLFEVEDIILDKLETIDSSTSISFPTLTFGCELVEDVFEDVDETTFAQAVLTGLCQLSTRIEEVSDESNPAFSFNTTCLGGSYTGRDSIIQKLIDNSCEQEERISDLESESVKTTDLCALVKQCIEDAEEPPVPINNQYNSRMVPFIYYPYGGPLANFDGTGKGLSAAGFEKVYLANGLNGTQDWRGFSPVGAIQNVPGATLDVKVDPSIPANSPYNYVAGSKYGVNTVTLNETQIPAHSHSITDPGHSHFTVSMSKSTTKGASPAVFTAWSSNNANGNQDYDLCYLSTPPNANPTSNSSTGISVQSTGSGAAHANVSPVVGCLFIVYIP